MRYMIDKNLTVAFTGHRTFKINRGNESLFSSRSCEPAEIEDSVLEQVLFLVSEGSNTFLCGMAEGFDLIAARAVLRAKIENPAIRLVCVEPYKRISSDKSGGEYFSILSRSDMRIAIAGHYSVDCFHRRNDFLVDNSSVIVCYYNGTPGGTQYTVKKAVRSGHRIINIYG